MPILFNIFQGDNIGSPEFTNPILPDSSNVIKGALTVIPSPIQGIATTINNANFLLNLGAGVRVFSEGAAALVESLNNRSADKVVQTKTEAAKIPPKSTTNSTPTPTPTADPPNPQRDTTNAAQKKKANEEVTAAIIQATDDSKSLAAAYALTKGSVISDSLTTAKLAASTGIAESLFYVEYVMANGSKSRFRFALLPAIESTLQISSSSMVRGAGASVPEVKAGVVIMNSMKYKNIIIPGGAPVVQAVGIDNTRIMLVGALIGSETFSSNTQNSTRPSEDPIYMMGGQAVYTDTGGATDRAKQFRQNVVYSMQPVTIKIIATNSDSPTATAETLGPFTGVILEFKEYSVRRNRVYYAIDMLLTNYTQ